MAKAAPKYLAREMSMSEAVSEAMSELQTLAEEMREAFDNTPESLQGGGVGEARGEAADNLENLSEPDVPTSLEAIKVAWSVRELSPSKLRKQSRSDRRNDALETLSAVTAKLEEIKDDEASSEELAGDAETLRDEIENLMSDAENVEFPGMYG
jgi:hypothetical protein